MGCLSAYALTFGGRARYSDGRAAPTCSARRRVPLAALPRATSPPSWPAPLLAGIGLALAFLLPGRPRKPAHELPEPDPAADAAAAGDVVIRSGTK